MRVDECMFVYACKGRYAKHAGGVCFTKDSAAATAVCIVSTAQSPLLILLYIMYIVRIWTSFTVFDVG